MSQRALRAAAAASLLPVVLACGLLLAAVLAPFEARSQDVGAVGAPGRVVLLGSLIGANMNSTADQSIVLSCPATKCTIDHAIVTNSSGSLSAVTGGLFAGASGTSPILSSVTTASTWTSMTAGMTTRLTLMGAGVSPNAANSVSANAIMTGATQTIFLHLGAGEGSAQTADVYVFGEVLN